LLYTNIYFVPGADPEILAVEKFIHSVHELPPDYWHLARLFSLRLSILDTDLIDRVSSYWQ